MPFAKQKDVVNHSHKYSFLTPLAPAKAPAAFAAQWRSGLLSGPDGNAKYLLLFSSSSNILLHWNLLVYITTALLWSLEMKVYLAGLLCLEKTNYFLTLTHLSFSISLNDSLSDFLMFIFSVSTWSWQRQKFKEVPLFLKTESWKLIL